MSDVTTSEATTPAVAMSEAAGVSRKNPPESPQPSAGRILIIDDEAEIRESLETLLQLEGYTVVAAGSGGEGKGWRRLDSALLTWFCSTWRCPTRTGWMCSRRFACSIRSRQ